ncbi:hypothetical protein [Actinoplanes sp. NPDC049802]|uniref:hypothetical protein n=1 Tax=Actinoplanes sp. NPDC049802 TaxID=3154742 RepID=UPI00340DF128
MSHPDHATEPGAEIEPVAPRAPEEVGRTVAALTADDLEEGGRRRLLGRLAGQLRGRGVGRLFRPSTALRWIADTVADLAPHVPVRDRETLRRHFPGMDDEELATRLIRNAARATAGVGAAGGGIASVEWVAAPALLSAPVLLATETVAVVAIEIKLVGELHELYGRPITGDVGERAWRLIEAWSGQRGVNPMMPGGGVATVLGTASRKELQKALMKRFGRNLTTLAPMLTGAAVASYLNRRATRAVGDKVHDELRRKGLTEPSGRPALDR